MLVILHLVIRKRMHSKFETYSACMACKASGVQDYLLPVPGVQQSKQHLKIFTDS